MKIMNILTLYAKKFCGLNMESHYQRLYKLHNSVPISFKWLKIIAPI